ncbi:9217_t:CDS:2 [Funneliformis caledonium]|uniref:9217_t:CDS:1 n=1 Tax=Funneliformis caledonium TaxID=1117310 RepID=A0A9N9FAG6_9GLOM|nr:9217_t:CDS:2 [Funneliformis caledonium]
MVTLIYAVIVVTNFDRGLQEIIENYKDRMKQRPTNINGPTMNVTTLNIPSAQSIHTLSSSTSHQFPVTSLSNDKISYVSDESKGESRWTIDD